MQWLARWYARRVVNVNVNIIAAGLFALPPTMLVVHFSRHFGVTDDRRALILAVTFLTDIVFDVATYFLLHWLANHGSWRNKFLDKAEQLLVEPAHKGSSFMHDASLVQFERAILSPLLYSIWLGVQYFLMQAGMDRVAAMGLGWILGIGSARTLHTLWMLRQERLTREKRLAARRLCRSCGFDLRGVTADKCPECGQLIQPVGAPAPKPVAPGGPRPADLV